LAFVLINPFDFFPDYDVELTDEQAEILDLEDPEDAVMFTTVTVSREAGKVTTNLAGPIVMNRRTLRMRQIVFQDDNYSTKAVIGEMPCASTDKELVKAA
jgi:flagellar assembly factor FliW